MGIKIFVKAHVFLDKLMTWKAKGVPKEYFSVYDAADNVVSGEEREDAEPTDVSVPLPPTPVQQWYLNPQRSNNVLDQDAMFSLAPQMLPLAPPHRYVEFSEDLDRLIIQDENALFLPPPPTHVVPTRRPTAPRIDTEREVPVVAVPVLPPPPPDAHSLSTIVAADQEAKVRNQVVSTIHHNQTVVIVLNDHLS